MTLTRLLAVLAAAAMLVCTTLLLDGNAARAQTADDPAYLSMGVGYFDVLDDEDAADFRLEYRHDRGLWVLKPWVGLEATSDGAVYGALGILADLHLTDQVVLIPSFGAGAFEEGDGKDLGHTIEFRSAAELAWRFDDRSRLGLEISHRSNADIGDKNPGEESLM
ncbi:MAG: acyloxyacyl hydrolase, partial [Kiloniellales bacterium]